ncbi:MAG: metallophosphoesterase [Chloroflexota bacterium]
MNSKSKRALTRRDFLKLMKFTGLEVALMAFGGGIYMKAYEPTWLEVVEVNLKLPRLPRSFSGMRVLQLSDLHYGGWMTSERLEGFLDVAVSLSPDLVVITGDFVMKYSFDPEYSNDLDELALALQKLTSAFPTAGVFGNHDHWLGQMAMLDLLQKAGVTDLNNGVYPLKNGSETLYLAGVDSALKRRDRLGMVLAQLPADGCALLLAHEPDYADTSASYGRFDLQLSGHSHGGQFVMPFVGPLVLPPLGRKYAQGLYRVRDMLQYTNRGLGMVRPYVRFNCRPEMTLFTLEAS